MYLKDRLLEATIDRISQEMIDNKQREIQMLNIKLRDDKNLSDTEKHNIQSTITSLQNQIEDLSGNVIDRELTNLDLENLLNDARLIVSSVTSEEFVDKNDVCQSINFGSLANNELGKTYYEEQYGYTSSRIVISDFLKSYEKNQVLNVVLHEFIHSLECCSKCGHRGTWLNIANAINAKYNNKYDVNTTTDLGDGMSNYYEYQKTNHKTRYRIECDNCGFLMYQYSTNSKYVKNPENFTHNCKDGNKGNIIVVKED